MTAWLIDKSALVRIPTSPDADTWVERARNGYIRISSVTLLEMGYSARNARDFKTMFSTPPLSQLQRSYLTPAVQDRALDVLEKLAQQGHHRAPSVPDLFIAAAAEHEQLVVLHLDKDFDLIAEVTGQPVERLRLS